MILGIRNGIKPVGAVSLPPSKSEAIRAAILCGICGSDPARAIADYAGMPVCDDVKYAIAAAKDIDRHEAYVGSSAALLRMILPYKLLAGGAEITADDVLLERGIREIEECFGVEGKREGNLLSLHIPPEKKNMSRFVIDCSRSSQFLSGLLIALPLIGRECDIVIKNGLVSKPYADMTLDLVRLFGGLLEETETGYRTYPSRYSVPNKLPVTGDRSYAAVFEAMNLLGGSVAINGADENTRQPDKDFINLAGKAECDIKDHPDLLPLLAAAACGKKGDTVIRGTRRLKTKESDRESGTVRLIRDLGGSAEASCGAVTVHGTGRLSGGECSSLGDHRLAFAAAVMAMISENPVTLHGAECVSKSAPQFRDDLERIGYGLDR
ncbi:MAG: hypothetical protein J5854_00830 [Clostridia bacterium]|nr:hypothetical protein [Clostridia bacterium]